MPREELNLKNLLLASFFHDIGKFIQRGEKFKKTHYSLSLLFSYIVGKKIKYSIKEIDWDIVAQLAGYHHEKELLRDDKNFNYLWQIIKKADDLAAETQRDTNKLSFNPSEINQHDIFPLLFLKEKLEPQVFLHEIHPLYELEKFMPRDYIPQEDNQRNYRLYLGEKEMGFFLKSILEKKTPPSFLNFLYALDDIFYIFYTQIPEDSRDIYQLNSLYDHLKLTCLFSFLYYFGESFYVLKVDIAGIQKFIFDIKSTKAAKILRGRSLFIQILTDILAHNLIVNLELIPQVVVDNFGGNLTLFLPKKPKILEKVDQLIKETAYFYLLNFDLALRVNNYHKEIPLNKESIINLYDKDQPLSKEVNEKGFFNQIFFNLEQLNNKLQPEEVDDTSLCDFCQRPRNLKKIINIGKEKLITCDQCFLFYHLSENIIKDRKPFYIDLEKLSLETNLEKEDDKFLFFKPYRNLIKQREKNKDYFLSSPSKTLYYDVINAGGKSFEELVLEKKSAPLLLYLKGDVDNMARILDEGFNFRRNDQKNSDKKFPRALTDILHFSRRINIFFQNYLPFLIEKTNYKDKIYLVYSGGDDFFMIGHWLEILEFIFFHFHPAFKKFVCNNPKTTYSLGGVLAKPNDPLFLMTEKVEEKLTLAKKTVTGDGKKGKFAFLYSILEIGQWQKLMEHALLINKSQVTNSFLYKVFKLTDYFADPKNNYQQAISFQKITYFFYRMINKENFLKNKNNQEFITFFKEILSIPRDDNQELRFKRENLKSIINLALLLRRKEGGERNGF